MAINGKLQICFITCLATMEKHLFTTVVPTYSGEYSTVAKILRSDSCYKLSWLSDSHYSYGEFFNKTFMTNFITTIGDTIYVPRKGFNEWPDSAMSGIIAHEFVHIQDSSNDKLFKIRPIITYFNDIFSKLYNSATLSIDEAMVLYKGRSSFKQFMKLKPIRFGFKIW